MAAARAADSRHEIERLRSLVEDQHRRLRLYESELSREDERGDVIEAFPSRCAKVRVSPTRLAALIKEAEERLQLEESALGAALRSHWFEAKPGIPVLHPSPGLGAYGKGTKMVPNAVCSLFGRSQNEQRLVLERIVKQQQGGQPFVPILLTNDPDFSALRAARLVFEYFPFNVEHGAKQPPSDWAAFFIDMIELCLRRWGASAVVEL